MLIELNYACDGGDRLAVEAPDVVQRDERVPVRVTGARPGETVELEATVEDPEGVTWRSSAAFTADANGVVDPAEQAPDAGSYEGVAPMGWCWSMTPDEDATVIALANAGAVTARLRAAAGGREAETTVTLRTQSPETTRQRVAGEETPGVVGTLYEPAGEGSHPGVLVLHGSGGGPLEGMASLLAGRGYAAFAVEYFGDAAGIPDTLARVPVSTVGRAADWLRDCPGVRDGRVGVVGTSRGGELALLAGARSDRLGPVVSSVGSGVVWDTPDGTPVWVADGDPVPHVSGPDAPAIDAGYLESLSDDEVAEATIPVERIDGPVLLVSAGEDGVWPSRRLSAVAADRLAEAEFAHGFEHLTYDDAGHYVTAPYLPKTDDVFGGTPAGTARADADAWSAALDTLDRGLGVDDRGDGKTGPTAPDTTYHDR